VILGVLGLYVISLVFRRFIGRGEPYDLEERAKRHWNDLAEAAAPVRTIVQLGLGVLLTGLFLIRTAFLGADFLQSGLLIWWASSIAFLWAWAWVERWFAWPGLFVVPEARGTQGVFFARRAERRGKRQSQENHEHPNGNNGASDVDV
jgi:hypothetical protein